MKKETINMLATNQLTQAQMTSYWVDGYGYGLGQRCPINDKKSDFGWGGAAGSWYAIDRENNITLFLATHVLGYAKFQTTRSQILSIVQEIINGEQVD